MRLAHLFLALACTLGAMNVCRADPDPRQAARGHYARGLELANNGVYDAALREFKVAYAISPNYAVLYNIGQSYVALGLPLEAVQTLSQYLREGQDGVPLSRREQVQAQVTLLESRLAELSITTDRPGALISVDGREIGRTPLFQPVRLAAGEYTISSVLEGSPEVKRHVVLREADRQALNLELPQVPLETSSSQSTKLLVQCAETGVEVFLDGSSISLEKATQGVVIPPGRHRVGFTAPGGRTSEQSLDIPAGAMAVITCGSLPPAMAVQPDLPAAAANARGVSSTIGYTLSAAGVAIGGVALGQYFWNKRRYNDWTTENAALASDRAAPSYFNRQVANNDLAESIERGSRVTVGLALAGGTLLATGITLVLTDHGNKTTTGRGNPSVPTSGLALGWAGPSAGAVVWSGKW